MSLCSESIMNVFLTRRVDLLTFGGPLMVCTYAHRLVGSWKLHFKVINTFVGRLYVHQPLLKKSVPWHRTIMNMIFKSRTLLLQQGHIWINSFNLKLCSCYKSSVQDSRSSHSHAPALRSWDLQVAQSVQHIMNKTALHGWITWENISHANRGSFWRRHCDAWI